MKRWTVLFFLMLPTVLFANEGGHSGGEAHAGFDEHTLKTVIYQAINVGILVGALVYYLKDAVRNFFQEKKAAFLQSAEKVKAAKQTAEEDHLQIKIQLTKLESTADETISRAKAEAADLKHQLMSEAQALSKKIREEAEQSARYEVEKAKNSIREKMIHEASLLAAAEIAKKAAGEDQSRLQGDFVHNIGVAQS